MPRYLLTARYTSEGAKGLLAQGGSARRTAAEKSAADLGGSVETFDFAFGEDDVYAIIEMPDNKSAAAMAMTISASGRVHVHTTPLMTPEEVDLAVQHKVTYSPPGS